MTRLENQLASLSGSNKKALGIFVTAGYPTLDATAEILHCLDKAGVDFIELGMPFSDPLAEGKTIQETSRVALENGVDLQFALDTVSSFREGCNTPVLLMGYVNPVYRFGYSNFCAAAASSGVDGLIIADLPVHESDDLVEAAARSGINIVHLITPNTSDERIRLVDQKSSGFVYAVSLIGLTGANVDHNSQVVTYLNRARRLVEKNSLMAGFGIRTKDDSNMMAACCDGIIVGSSFLSEVVTKWNTFADSAEKQQAVSSFVEAIRPDIGTIESPVR